MFQKDFKTAGQGHMTKFWNVCTKAYFKEKI